MSLTTYYANDSKKKKVPLMKLNHLLNYFGIHILFLMINTTFFELYIIVPVTIGLCFTSSNRIGFQIG